MKIVKIFIFTSIVLTSCLFSPFTKALSSEKLNSVRLYHVYFSGFKVGDLVISAKGSDAVVNVDVAIKSYGIAKSATNYRCTASSYTEAVNNSGSILYLPKSFNTIFRLRKKTRNIEIKFDKNGKVIEHKNLPKEHPKKRPPISQNLKDGAYDPLSIALVVRQKIKELRDSGALDKKATKFSLPLFDGRRRSDLNFTIHGREIQTVMEKDTKVIHLSFENVPVAGFTNNEIRNLPKHNPLINVYVSDDELLLPVKGDGETRIGWAVGSLYKECATMEDCGGKIEW